MSEISNYGGSFTIIKQIFHLSLKLYTTRKIIIRYVHILYYLSIHCFFTDDAVRKRLPSHLFSHNTKCTLESVIITTQTWVNYIPRPQLSQNVFRSPTETQYMQWNAHISTDKLIQGRKNTLPTAENSFQYTVFRSSTNYLENNDNKTLSELVVDPVSQNGMSSPTIQHIWTLAWHNAFILAGSCQNTCHTGFWSKSFTDMVPLTWVLFTFLSHATFGNLVKFLVHFWWQNDILHFNVLFCIPNHIASLCSRCCPISFCFSIIQLFSTDMPCFKCDFLSFYYYLFISGSYKKNSLLKFFKYWGGKSNMATKLP